MFGVIRFGGRVTGEGEEDVVERGLVDFDVVDGDAGLVEGAHDGGGEPGAALDRCAQPPSVVADVHGAVDQGP